MTVCSSASPLLRTLAFPDSLTGGSTKLEALKELDPMGFCLFVLALEQSLPGELPADLLDVLVTLDDLMAFVEVKAGRAP